MLDAFDSLATCKHRKVTDIDDAIFLVLDFFLGQALEAQRALREAFYALDSLLLEIPTVLRKVDLQRFYLPRLHEGGL